MKSIAGKNAAELRRLVNAERRKVPDEVNVKRCRPSDIQVRPPARHDPTAADLH